MPAVPVAKYCTCAVNPFNADIPVENVVITWHKCVPCVCNVMVLPLCVTYTLIANLSVIVNDVWGTASAVTYKSIDVPPVIPSGVAELSAIKVSTTPSYLYNST